MPARRALSGPARAVTWDPANASDPAAPGPSAPSAHPGLAAAGRFEFPADQETLEHLQGRSPELVLLPIHDSRADQIYEERLRRVGALQLAAVRREADSRLPRGSLAPDAAGDFRADPGSGPGDGRWDHLPAAEQARWNRAWDNGLVPGQAAELTADFFRSRHRRTRTHAQTRLANQRMQAMMGRAREQMFGGRKCADRAYLQTVGLPRSESVALAVTGPSAIDTLFAAGGSFQPPDQLDVDFEPVELRR